MSKNATPAAKQEISSAIKQICEEKNISYESVIDTIQQALAAAYRKDFGQKNQNIITEFNPETGKTRAFDLKTVVEDLPEEELEELTGKKESKEEKQEGEKKSKSVNKETKETKKEPVEARPGASKEDEKPKKEEKTGESAESKEDEKPKFNPRTDLQLSDAKKIKKTAKVGDEIRTKLEIPAEFGRMAAQTAKQVIIQRLREAERATLFNEYKDKEGQVMTGIVQRQEGRLVLVDLGNATAIIPPDGQIENENYNSGQRYRLYISEVRETSKGPEIIVSRTHPEIVKQLFKVEVPEIASGTVEIKALAREAGSRSKVAVATDDESIDPIGSCVGQRGSRIQTIITELGGEKIDIIQYSDDTKKFIANALSPAKVVSVDLNQENKTATVKVRADQLSLAIGKVGQNVRLAAKLTGWKIDIKEAAAPGEKIKESDDKKESEKVEAEDKKAEDRGQKTEDGSKKSEEDKSKSVNKETKEKSDDKKSKKQENKSEASEKTEAEDKKASEAKPRTGASATGAGEKKAEKSETKEDTKKSDTV